MTERLTDERLVELEALAEVATPGPWSRTFGPREPSRVWASDDDAEPLAVLGGYVEGTDSVADAEFIAAAREALPALLAEVREHRAFRAGMRRETSTACRSPGPIDGTPVERYVTDWEASDE